MILPKETGRLPKQPGNSIGGAASSQNPPPPHAASQPLLPAPWSLPPASLQGKQSKEGKQLTSFLTQSTRLQPFLLLLREILANQDIFTGWTSTQNLLSMRQGCCSLCHGGMDGLCSAFLGAQLRRGLHSSTNRSQQETSHSLRGGTSNQN